MPRIRHHHQRQRCQERMFRLASAYGDHFKGEFWTYCKGHQTRHHVVMNGRLVEYRVDGQLDPLFASLVMDYPFDQNK